MLGLWLMLVGGIAFAGDKDKDGISNKEDACKTEPEDKDGFEDGDGCPDPDNDEDGLDDADDQCPDEPEDKDGNEDEDGEVDFDLLTKQGWMKSVEELMAGIFEAAGKQSEGCASGAEHVRSWLDAHDPVVEAQVFEAQLQRKPEYLEEQTFRDLLEGKGASYPSLQKALSIFCKDDAAWQGVQSELDTVMAPWMPKEEAE
mgnify:CR=1 FL=1